MLYSTRVPPKTRMHLTRLRVLLILILAVTSSSLLTWHFTAAIPSPSRSTTVEPGSSVKSCRVIITKDGSQAVDLDGQTGQNHVVTGTDNAVVVDALNNVLDAGRTQKERACFRGSFSFGTNPTAIAIPSFTTLDFYGAVLSVESDLSTTNTKLFTGTSITDVDIFGGIFNGIVGTAVSGVEPFCFFCFTGSQRITMDYPTAQAISGVLVSFQPPLNQNIRVYHAQATDGQSGGIDVTYDTVNYGEIAYETAIVWDSGPLIARSSNIIIHDNTIFSRRGPDTDIIIQNLSDKNGNITISNNQYYRATDDTLGSHNDIWIHDTGNPATSGTFYNIQINGNEISAGGRGPGIGIIESVPIQGLRISNNRFHDVTSAIVATPFGATPTDSGTQIIGNLGWKIGVPGAGGGGAAVWWRHPMNNTLIADNTFTDCNGGDLSNCLEFEQGLTNGLIEGNILAPIYIGAYLSRTISRPIFYSTGTGDRIINNDLSGSSSGAAGPALYINNKGYLSPYSTTGNTGAVSNAINFSPPSAAGTYQLACSADVTAWTTPASFTLQLVYTDASGTSRTETLGLIRGSTGAAVAAVTAVDRWYCIATTFQINNAGTAITFSTTGTFTGSPVYNLAATLTQIA